MTVQHEEGGAPNRTASDAGASAPSADPLAGTRGGRAGAAVIRLVRVVQSSDDAAVEHALLDLSRSRRWLAPLALMVGAFLALLQGVKLLFTNWRLTLVQILPAMWIWLAMLDLKAHLLHGRQFHVVTGPVLIPVALAVTALTAGSFCLNAVFAFAISAPGRPDIRPAFVRARQHLRVILAWGIGVGLALSFSSLVSTRWGRWPFAISQGIVVGVMMFCYLAVPARLIGMKPVGSRKDKLAATAVGSAMDVVICSPPYMLGRFGILMLGWRGLSWLGILLIVIGAALQTGTTTAVKAVKFSAKLMGGPSHEDSGDAGASAAPEGSGASPVPR